MKGQMEKKSRIMYPFILRGSSTLFYSFLLLHPQFFPVSEKDELPCVKPITVGSSVSSCAKLTLTIYVELFFCVLFSFLCTYGQ